MSVSTMTSSPGFLTKFREVSRPEGNGTSNPNSLCLLVGAVPWNQAPNELCVCVCVFIFLFSRKPTGVMFRPWFHQEWHSCGV